MLITLPLLMAASAPPTTAQAKTFMERLYAPYVAGRETVAPTDDPAVFTPDLLALISRDQDLTPADEVPTLNGDPICDCQDYAPLRRLTIDVRRVSTARATATVHFRNGPEAKRLSFRLEVVGGAWRIADVVSADSGGLVALLRDATERNVLPTSTPPAKP